ncbi:MAG: dihydropteroate synthase [Peptococcaceae bacterium]|nr:dihydropteroate synthase [Peptococcaceae bacterium]
MRAHNMRWIKIENQEQAEKALAQIGVHTEGIPNLKGEALTRVIKLENVPSAIALTLKQEMQLLGGDAAVKRELFVNGDKNTDTDVLLMGSNKELRMLIGRLKEQPLNLKEIAESLHKTLTSLEKSPVRNLGCRGINLELGRKTLIMGILNVTPDSFSDGGKFALLENALTQAAKLIEEGADILDIGAESSRPGYIPVSAEEEWSRLEPVLKELIPACKIPISVDTQKAEIAEKALLLGAHIVNDIWGLQKDPKMIKVVAGTGASIIIMHNKENTRYENIMGEVLSFLEQSIESALQHGVEEDHIVIDPGIGFGKTPEQNMEVISRLDELKVLGFPILLGVSRKSVIGKTLNLPVHERLEPTIALGALGVTSGADILRVHDVYENKKAVLMVDQIVRRKRGEDYEGK